MWVINLKSVRRIYKELMVRERKTRRRRKKRILLWRFIQRNDVVLKIYTSFAFVLAMTGVLIGLIFCAVLSAAAG